MAKRISSTQLKRRTREAIDLALKEKEVIVETYGQPQVVMVSYERYREIKDRLERQEKVRELGRTLRRVAKEAAEKLPPVSEEEAFSMAEGMHQKVWEAQHRAR